MNRRALLGRYKFSIRQRAGDDHVAGRRRNAACRLERDSDRADARRTARGAERNRAAVRLQLQERGADWRGAGTRRNHPQLIDAIW